MKSEVEMILECEDAQGVGADLVTNLGLIDVALEHEKIGCECQFCIGFRIGRKADEILKLENNSLQTNTP